MDKAEAAFQHSLETADWLRGIGYPGDGDRLERQARALRAQSKADPTGAPMEGSVR